MKLRKTYLIIILFLILSVLFTFAQTAQRFEVYDLIKFVNSTIFNMAGRTLTINGTLNVTDTLIVNNNNVQTINAIWNLANYSAIDSRWDASNFSSSFEAFLSTFNTE